MFDERTAELVAIGAAITANCQPCLEYHTTKARQVGVGDEDIREAIKVGQQVRRGASAKMDRFAAQQVAEQNEPVTASGCECQ